MWLQGLGFKGDYGNYGWHGSDGIIKIALFTNDTSMKYANKLMMETEKTFNKWRQAYYVRDMPVNKRSRKIVENHMFEIQKEFHIQRAEKCEYFFPVEEWDDV